MDLRDRETLGEAMNGSFVIFPVLLVSRVQEVFMGPAVLYRYKRGPGGWFMLCDFKVSTLRWSRVRQGGYRQDGYGLAWLAVLALGLYALAFFPARAEE